MQNRIYTFLVGVEQDTAPDPGTPVDPSDVVPFSYLAGHVAAAPRITNSYNTPYSAVAGTSIAHGLLANEDDCVLYLKGSSGAVDMSANPQIAAGTKAGQKLKLIFTSDTDTVFLENGTGLSMPDGPVRSKAGTVLDFVWDVDNSVWQKSYWNMIGGIL